MYTSFFQLKEDAFNEWKDAARAGEEDKKKHTGIKT